MEIRKNTTETTVGKIRQNPPLLQNKLLPFETAHKVELNLDSAQFINKSQILYVRNAQELSLNISGNTLYFLSLVASDKLSFI